MGAPAHRRIVALTLSLAAASLAVSGCGQKKARQQDLDEPNGNFPIRLISATFPSNQHLAKDSSMFIVVENAGSERIPDINVTVKCSGPGLGGSFNTTTDEQDVSDKERPQFIVNRIPTRRQRRNPPLDPAGLERSSALVDTYPLGPLLPRQRAVFRWDVTAVKAGPYRLCWRVNAGLYGRPKAVRANASPPLLGEFRGVVSNKAPTARVTPDGRVVEGPR